MLATQLIGLFSAYPRLDCDTRSAHGGTSHTQKTAIKSFIKRIGCVENDIVI